MRAVPCCAVLCRAVPCFAVLSLSYIPDGNTSKHTALARASMYVLEHFIQQSWYVRVCYVVEPRAQQSTAQHSSAIPPARSRQPSMCRSEYLSKKVPSKYVGTYVVRPVCFLGGWSSWHLQVVRLHLKCWTIYFTTSVLSFYSIHASL